MGPSAARKLKLDRTLDDDCRALDHQACSHIGAGGGLRTSYVVACTCRCHAECPATDSHLTEMDNHCTCLRTGAARQHRATQLGITHRRRHEIRRGSPETPEGEFAISVGFIVAFVLIAALFAGSLVVAMHSVGAVHGVAIALTVCSGLYLAWTALMFLLLKLMVTVFRAAGKRR